MGIVSAYLTKMIEQQRNKGLVIWFDPEGVYRKFAEANPEIIRYNGSFFELRYRLNDAMGGVAGHAGLFSTADDLAIFAQMMLDGGSAGTGSSRLVRKGGLPHDPRCRTSRV